MKPKKDHDFRGLFLIDKYVNFKQWLNEVEKLELGDSGYSPLSHKLRQQQPAPTHAQKEYNKKIAALRSLYQASQILQNIQPGEIGAEVKSEMRKNQAQDMINRALKSLDEILAVTSKYDPKEASLKKELESTVKIWRQGNLDIETLKNGLNIVINIFSRYPHWQDIIRSAA